AWLPIGWLVLFWMFVGYTTLWYGKLPEYNMPDPKESPEGSWIQFVLFLGIPLLLFFAIVSLVFHNIILLIYRKDFEWKILALLLINNVLLFLFLRLDFLGLID